MEIRNTPRFPFVLYGLGIIVVILVGLAALAFNIPIKKLTADPVQIFESKFYIGFLSNLTVLTWAVGGFGSLFAWWYLKTVKADREWVRFFWLAGLFTTVLMLDDLFMFHERIFPKHLFLPKLTGLEPNEKIPIAAYGIFAIWFFVSSRETIRKTQWGQLAFALALLAFSVIADRGIGARLIPHKATQAYLEEGAKYLGVVAWSAYYVLTAKAVILNHVGLARPDDSPSA